jgi:hypothetical protein
MSWQIYFFLCYFRCFVAYLQSVDLHNSNLTIVPEIKQYLDLADWEPFKTNLLEEGVILDFQGMAHYTAVIISSKKQVDMESQSTYFVPEFAVLKH